LPQVECRKVVRWWLNETIRNRLEWNRAAQAALFTVLLSLDSGSAADSIATPIVVVAPTAEPGEADEA